MLNENWILDCGCGSVETRQSHKTFCGLLKYSHVAFAMTRFLALPILLMSCSTMEEHLISKGEIQEFHNQGTLQFTLEKDIDFGNGLVVPIKFSVTTKGNGGFSLPGLFLVRIYDAHEDGSYFKPSLLENRLFDTNGNGYKEILLKGTALLIDQKTESQTGVVPVSAIISYNANSERFEVTEKSPEIDIYED